MARLQRVVLPGYPLHIMVRGHNSQDIFTTDEEKKSYTVSDKQTDHNFSEHQTQEHTDQTETGVQYH